MGLFNFFKKITKKRIEESKIPQEKITFSKVGDWIDKEGEKVEIGEKEIFVLIQKKIDDFTKEVEEKINILKGVDIKQKKVEDRIESIVNEGRKKYIESLKNFIKDLEGLKKVELDKFIKDINKVFLDFNKNSYKSYERTTILIGKETADLKNTLKTFSRDLVKLFDENRNIVDSFNKISLIKLNLKQIGEIEKTFKAIDEKTIFLENGINEKEKEKKEILEKIEKIKKSEDYLKNLEIQERIKLIENEFEKDLLNLKQFIDFKSLANFFHIFKEQMNIVKAHRDDFQTIFKKDDGESIIDLLNESKLNNETILEKLRQIKNKKREIIENKQYIKKDETEKLSSDILKLIQGINDIKDKKTIGEKRYRKIKVNRKELIDIVRDSMGKMNVEVEI